MKISYIENEPVPVSQLVELYNRVGWVKYTKDIASMSEILPGTTYYIAAWNEQNLVGLIRTISDNVSIAYVQDILVSPDMQRCGIGKKLIQKTLQNFGHIRQIVLITDDTEKTKGFYESIGLHRLISYECIGYMKLDK